MKFFNMPIPQLKHTQSWRSHKKYYVNRGKIIQRRQTARRKKGLFSSAIKKKILYFFGGAILICCLILAAAIFWLSRSLPDPNHLIEREVAQSTRIYDRTGKNIIYEIFSEQKRTLVKLSDIPADVKNATIAIEDKDFYKHKGFSFWAIFRSAVTDIIFRRSAGGSTLTQQFIKNAVLTNEKTLTRKIKELILAYRLEQKFSKDEILQMYLNEIPYGSTAYGVQAASQLYFGKDVKDTNLAEAAILAALPQAPTRYSPYGSHKDLLIGRQQYILELMSKQGYITEQEMNDAKNTEVKFKTPSASMIAPHFVMHIKEILSDKYGEKMVEQGGLKITTTLDLYKQNIAEEAIKTIGEKNSAKYDAGNAALLSLDPKTGQILAMVGSRDYFNDDIDGQVNVITSQRQPGSSIKPIIYSAAFIKGYTPNTILFDVVTNFSTSDTPYEPHNYDSKEHGPVTMRQALAGSLNVPAVKTLYLAGVDNVLNLAQDFGYTTFSDRSRFGLSLVLGGGEVKPIEHFNAFSAFAREGIIHPVTGLLKVEDSAGNVLEEYKDDAGKQVIDPKIAREINNILSDNSARAFIFGEKNYLTLDNRPVAAKTGTTNDYHDAWTIGYTPSIVTGVWVGNSD
ncbi:MAG: transglycosylase domain-containing protein, partial [Candidatus Falkowbacteria bacterium]|nr:transglycosylase domain-containing protein [Candidatus Falkowbacteria bacterium]